MFCPCNVGINMLFYYDSSTIFYTVHIITVITEKSGVTFLSIFFVDTFINNWSHTCHFCFKKLTQSDKTICNFNKYLSKVLKFGYVPRKDSKITFIWFLVSYCYYFVQGDTKITLCIVLGLYNDYFTIFLVIMNVISLY